jgi:DNA-binding GntR family transcriptional regulator
LTNWQRSPLGGRLQLGRRDRPALDHVRRHGGPAGDRWRRTRTARALDRRLHGLVCSAVQNRHLVSLSAHLTTAATLGLGAEPYEQDFLVQALHEHEELIAAIVDGDAEAAQRIAQAHFALTYVTMERSLERSAELAQGEEA